MAQNGERRAILERLAEASELGSFWRGYLVDQLLKPDPTVNMHLAIFVEPYLSAVLDGRKTIESRFGVHKRPPYLTVRTGDIIMIKRSGGPIVGLARAHSAKFYELSTGVLKELRTKFAHRLFALDDEFWDSRAEKQFATLIELEDVCAIEDTQFVKRDRRGWVTYSSDEPQQYELAC
jgi:ASC-1-like (ASCH) protein